MLETRYYSTLSINNSIFEGNSALQYAGAIDLSYLSADNVMIKKLNLFEKVNNSIELSDFSIENNLFRSNRASFAGAVMRVNGQPRFQMSQTDILNYQQNASQFELSFR